MLGKNLLGVNGSASGNIIYGIEDPHYSKTSLYINADDKVDGDSNNSLGGTFSVIGTGSQPGSFNPFSAPQGYWCLGFDGSGDYLTYSNVPGMNLGTNNFVIDFWIYPTAYVNNSAQIIGTVNGSRTGYAICIGSTINDFRIISDATGSWADTLYAGTGNGPELNKWTHFALVRNGATISLYKNGNRVAQNTNAASWNFKGTTAVIGRMSESAYVNDFNGFICDIKVYIGGTLPATSTTYEVPTSAFSPAGQRGTLVFSAAKNRNQSSDQVLYSRTTVYGDVKCIPETVYKYEEELPSTDSLGSVYLNGSTHIVDSSPSTQVTLGTSDFTLETWVYRTNASQCGLVNTWQTGGQFILRILSSGYAEFFANSTTGNLSLVSNVTATRNGWQHIAVSRSGNQLAMFIDGTTVGTLDVTGKTFAWYNGSVKPYVIGTDGDRGNKLNGFLSDVRYVVGTALYTASSPPLVAIMAPLSTPANTKSHLRATQNGIVDRMLRVNMTTNTNVRVSTENSKYGTGSVKFSNNNFLRLSTSPVLNLSVGDFTVEMWFYNLGTTTSKPSDLICIGNLNSNSQHATLRIVISSDGQRIGALMSATGGSFYDGNFYGDIQLNRWHHVAVSKNGNDVTLYVDGVMIKRYTGITQLVQYTTQSNAIGSLDCYDNFFNGYLDDIRVTKGVGRYTANFQP